jgi:putative transposase
MAKAYPSLTHARWVCKDHVGFVPKRRRPALFGHMRPALGPIFDERARQQACQLIDGQAWRSKMLMTVPRKRMVHREPCVHQYTDA